MLVSVEAALGLVFDPRYRDIPFAPLTAAAVPFLIVLVRDAALGGSARAAESVAAAVLALSAGYIVFNETFANWQSVWFCAGIARARRSFCCWRGTRQAQDEHAGRERRQIGIVQHDAERRPPPARPQRGRSTAARG